MCRLFSTESNCYSSGSKEEILDLDLQIFRSLYFSSIPHRSQVSKNETVVAVMMIALRVRTLPPQSLMGRDMLAPLNSDRPTRVRDGWT